MPPAPHDFEPWRRKTALQAGAIMAFFLGGLFFQSDFVFSQPAPPAILVSLVPDPPQPAPSPEPQPVPEPEPQPEPEVVEETPKEDEAAKAAAAAAAAEQQKRVAELVRQKQEAERRKKEEEEKREEEARKKREREEAEKKRQAEEAARKKREEEQRKQEEERKKREEEKKKQEAEEAARKKREAEEERQRQLAEAQARRQDLLQRRQQRVANQIIGQIVARINDYLRTPASIPPGADVEIVVLVKLERDGNLRSFPEIIESSGYPEYDDAALRAILQAAPLPMPRDAFITDNPTLLADFLEHRLVITPHDL